MTSNKLERFRLKRARVMLSWVFAVLLSASPISILAHGGEDHGDQKPKSTANAKGIVSHSAR